VTKCLAVLLTFLLLQPTFGAGQAVGTPSLAGWGTSLEVDPRIPREILRFQEGGTALGEDLARTFAMAIRSRVFTSAGRQVDLLLNGECKPFVDVSMGTPDSLSAPEVSGDLKKAWEKFGDSVVRTEMVACLETDIPDPAEVLQLYVSPEFRMVAEGRIIDMWEGPEGQCMETKGVLRLVDPTRVCNRIQDFRGEGVAAQHSQVVFNEGKKPYQDVYFKESLKTFVRIPGGMALHYINYARVGGLGRLERWAGPGQIRGSQEGNVEELRKRLRARSSKTTGMSSIPSGAGA